MRDLLTNKEIRTSIVEHHRFRLISRCAVCRGKAPIDIRTFYCSAMDQLDTFTKAQQRALDCIKRNDPMHSQKMKDLTKRRADERFNRTAWAKYREGKMAKLCGLKRREWNGRVAEIIGDKVEKNGIVRFPVRLLYSPRDRALIKECNLDIQPLV